MKLEEFTPRNITVLNPEQRQRFHEYLPGKVYKTERNISVLVALSQLCMIFMFLSNKHVTFETARARGYLALYVFLLITTGVALILYRYTYHGKKYTFFIWLRRIYSSMLCFWVLGITFLEQMGGHGISVYCYLLPTTAALLLLTPLESTVIFGGTGTALIVMLINLGRGGNIFGNVVNSTFVTILTLFISYRYYRSMAVEFCDRETIASQYEEIEKSNALFRKMAHYDQLTGLYNRHYLLEKIYPMFEKYQQSGYLGMFLMLDIDFFKQYNDNYGHIQGDVCLKQISEILKQFSKDNGAYAVRYGGEEFLIVKMNQGIFDGVKIAQKLLDEVWKANLVRTDVDFGRVTVSMGIWSGRLHDVEHIENAIKCADEALYEAKSTGRNKLVSKNPVK